MSHSKKPSIFVASSGEHTSLLYAVVRQLQKNLVRRVRHRRNPRLFADLSLNRAGHSTRPTWLHQTVDLLPWWRRPSSRSSGLPTRLDRAPEKRAGKRGWLHPDFYAIDVPREVERLASIGAKRHPWGYPPNADCLVLEDPDGKLCCVVQELAETWLRPAMAA